MTVKISIATPLNIVSIVKYFIELNKDVFARRYYRYMHCQSPFEIFYCLFYFFYKITFNKIIFNIFHKYLILVIAVDESMKKIIGICHIDVYKEPTPGLLVGYYGISLLGEWRGRGIGKILSIIAFKIAKELNVKLVRLHVDTDNKRALKLYKNLGFKIKKSITKCDYRNLTDEFVDCYLMEKILV